MPQSVNMLPEDYLKTKQRKKIIITEFKIIIQVISAIYLTVDISLCLLDMVYKDFQATRERSTK